MRAGQKIIVKSTYLVKYGILPGDTISIVSVGLFGGPIVFKQGLRFFALRRKEALELLTFS